MVASKKQLTAAIGTAYSAIETALAALEILGSLVEDEEEVVERVATDDPLTCQHPEKQLQSHQTATGTITFCNSCGSQVDGGG